MTEQTDPYIYHLVLESDFQSRTSNDLYTPPRFEQDGFIHCTAGSEMTLAVARDFFAGRENVLLLRIRIDRLTAPVRFEAAGEPGSRNALRFPHIYGPLNLGAVQGMAKFAFVDQSTEFPQFS